ncbi:hypothetical protein Lal_00024395 [Lupinus albus]|nr:hypothetical protein Lal_00024395 [Lupinus albus]
MENLHLRQNPRVDEGFSLKRDTCRSSDVEAVATTKTFGSRSSDVEAVATTKIGWVLAQARPLSLKRDPWRLSETPSLKRDSGTLLGVFFQGAIPLTQIDENLTPREIEQQPISCASQSNGKYIQPTPILLPIKILEDFTKPLSLSFRLFGNILADELVVVVLVSLVPLVVPISVMFLGFFTSGIQALIFTTLVAAYIGESMEGHH